MNACGSYIWVHSDVIDLRMLDECLQNFLIGRMGFSLIKLQ